MINPEINGFSPHIIVTDPISPRVLMGEALLDREPNPLNLDLTQTNVLFGAAINPQTQDASYTGVLTHTLVGNELNRLLYTIATHKDRFFKLDTQDVKSDFDFIAKNNPYAQNLRRLHERLVGKEPWSRFMKDREFLRKHIEDGEFNSPDQVGIVPLIQWTTNSHGKRKWGEDDPAGKVWSALKTRPLNLPTDRDDISFLPIGGQAFVTLMSPEITSGWPEFVHNQPMGPTQILGLVLKYEQQLLTGSFIRHAETYVRKAAGL